MANDRSSSSYWFPFFYSSVEHSVVVSNPSIISVSCLPSYISKTFLFFTPENEWHLFLRDSGKFASVRETIPWLSRTSAMHLSRSIMWTLNPVNVTLLRKRWGWRVFRKSFSSFSTKQSESSRVLPHDVFFRLQITTSSFSTQNWALDLLTQLISNTPRLNLEMVIESLRLKPSFVIFPENQIIQANSWWVCDNDQCVTCDSELGAATCPK